MGGAARRRENRPVAAPATEGRCAFCGSDAQDETTVGRLYILGSTTLHYYCALLSCGLVQRGSDEEGLFGFLLDDILTELYRGKKLKCSYCSGGGATVACCVSQCRKMFHLPCGRRRGSVSIFYGSYSSFCITHAPMQDIPECILTKARSRKAVRSLALRKSKSSTAGKEVAVAAAESGEDAICSICYEEVEPWPSTVTFWPPCCARDRWLHVPCIQRMALSAGMHYLKCPLCNDKETFQKAIASHGVYIPDRDASWELEGDAYADLYERPKSCSAEECKCYQGREYDADQGRWELKMCLTCGSVAVHAGCLSAPRHVCERCSTVPPPDNLEALESIPLPRPEVESAAPEYHPLMSCRMSVRRTKPSAARNSSSHARPDYFKMERVVKVVKSQQYDDDLEDVDVESMDQPGCSKSDGQIMPEGSFEKPDYNIIRWLLDQDKSRQCRMLDIDPRRGSNRSINRNYAGSISSKGVGNEGSLWRKLIEKSERSIERDLNRSNVFLELVDHNNTNKYIEEQSDVNNMISKDIEIILDESNDRVDQTSEVDESKDEIESVIEIESSQSSDASKDLDEHTGRNVIHSGKRSLRSDRNHRWSERITDYFAKKNSPESSFTKDDAIKTIGNEIKDKQCNQSMTNDVVLDESLIDDKILDITNALDKNITNKKLLYENPTNDQTFVDSNCVIEGRKTREKLIEENIMVDENEMCERILDKNENVKMCSDKTDNELTSSDSNDKVLSLDNNTENISYGSVTNENINSNSHAVNQNIASYGNDTNGKVSSDSNDENIIVDSNTVKDVTSDANDTNIKVSLDNNENVDNNAINEDVALTYNTNGKTLHNHTNISDANEVLDISDSNDEETAIGDTPKKVFDKITLTELEDKIISPLKMIEQKIYAKLTGSDDGGFKQRIDDNVRRMKRPGPMSVKKKVIENILESLLQDCNTGAAATVLDPETTDRITFDGSAAQDLQSYCNKNHSSSRAHTISPRNRQDSSVDIDLSTNSIHLSRDNIELSKENIDLSAGNIDLNKENIDLSKETIDLSKEKIDLSADNIDLSKENVDLSKENIDISTGNIVSPSKTVNMSIDSTKVEILESALEISCKETVNIDYVNPSVNAKVEGVRERGRIIFSRASETCDRIQKYNRREHKKCSKLKVRLSNAEEVIIESSKLDSEHHKAREIKEIIDKSPVRKWGAELSKAADVESFKSRYLSEVGQYKCNFNHRHKHEDAKETKPRIKTAIDFAIEAAVRKRREAKEAEANSQSVVETLNKKSILKGDFRSRRDKEVKFKDSQRLEGAEKEVSKRRKSESEKDCASNAAEKVVTPRKSIEVLQNLITAFENSNTSSGKIVLPSLSALDSEDSKKVIRNTDKIEKIFSPEKHPLRLDRHCLTESGTLVEKPNLTLEKPGTMFEKPGTMFEKQVTAFEKPVATSEKSVATSEKPVAIFEKPVTTSEKSRTIFEKSVATSENPVSTLEKEIPVFEKLCSTVEKPPSAEGPTAVEEVPPVEKSKPKTRPGVETHTLETGGQSLKTEVITRGTVIEKIKKKFDKFEHVAFKEMCRDRTVVINGMSSLDVGGSVNGNDARHLEKGLAPTKRQYRKRKRKGTVQNECKKARYEECETIKDTELDVQRNLDNDAAVETKRGKRKNKSWKKELQKQNEKLFDGSLMEFCARETKNVENNTKFEQQKNMIEGKRKNVKFEADSYKRKEKRLNENRLKLTDAARQSSRQEYDSERDKNRKNKKIYKTNSKNENRFEAKQEKRRRKRAIDEIKKSDFNETNKHKERGKEEINQSNFNETNKEEKDKDMTDEKQKAVKINSEAGHGKRKRQRVDYSDQHGFVDELDRVNEYYLKDRKRKKRAETLKSHDSEPKLVQSLLNFSPNGPKVMSPPNDKEKPSHSVSLKKKRKLNDFTDGLKQTTLNNFFSLHLTLT